MILAVSRARRRYDRLDRHVDRPVLLHHQLAVVDDQLSPLYGRRFGNHHFDRRDRGSFIVTSNESAMRSATVAPSPAPSNMAGTVQAGNHHFRLRQPCGLRGSLPPAVGSVRGFAFTLGVTTVLDLVVVMMFTYPLMTSSQRPPSSGRASVAPAWIPSRLEATPRYAGVHFLRGRASLPRLAAAS